MVAEPRSSDVWVRVLYRFGLPGHAFVPLLTAHACALPAIMSTRLIPDRRDRLATIMVAPFMSCSARLPVYVLLTSLLFRDRPLLAGLAFAACYVLGGMAALASAWIFGRTMLPGRARPMALELPSYATLAVVPERAAALEAAATMIEGRAAHAGSFAGIIGRTLQPVFEPLGYDWQLTVGVLTSFLAREVFVSTLSVLVGGGGDSEVDDGVIDRIRGMAREDGAPVFTVATSASALVFFVLAMQCLPTLAVTRRETGAWRYAGLQLVYMSALAYVAAFILYQSLRAAGVN